MLADLYTIMSMVKTNQIENRGRRGGVKQTSAFFMLPAVKLLLVLPIYFFRNEAAFKARVHWLSLLVKTSARAKYFLLALASLGGATQIGSFLFLSHRARRSRQVH